MPQNIGQRKWQKMSEYFIPKNILRLYVLVKNAWVFCTRKYWTEIDVRNAYVFSVSKNIGRKWYKMCEYFLPTIRLPTQSFVQNTHAFCTGLYRPKNVVQNAWVFCTTYKINKKVVTNAWVFCSRKYLPKKVVKNAWVFCSRKYLPKKVVKNAWVFCTKKNWPNKK